MRIERRERAAMRLKGREKKRMQGILYEVSCNIEKEEKKKERGDDRETRISRELPPECRFAEGACPGHVCDFST